MPTEPMIEPDPGRKLAKIFAALTRMFENEKVTVFKCQSCGNEIQFNGHEWEHIGDSLRHAAQLQNDI